MRLIILIFLVYILYRVLKALFGAAKSVRDSVSPGTVDEMVQDPYCKTYVPLRDSQKRVVNGREQFFCSRDCADKFMKEIGNEN